MACDRLSVLPDSLILEILSRLPMKEVVKTMLFSKRWKNVWTTVPCLEFHLERDGTNSPIIEFQRLVSGALERWEGDKIRKLSVCFSCENSLKNDVNSLLRLAVKKNVEELHLEILTFPRYSPPCTVYSCSSIKELTLKFVHLGIESLNLNHLKSLTIESFFEVLSQESMNVILDGSPALEILNLKMQEVLKNFKIESEILKDLKIRYFLHDPAFTIEAILSVNAPNLENLELSGLSHTICMLKVPSLKYAVVGLNNRGNRLVEEHLLRKFAEDALRQNFRSISQVQNLTLNEWTFKLLVDQMENGFFVEFPNVKSLKLYAREAEGIPRALKMFPVLDMLAIEHKESAYYLVAPKTVIPDPSLLQLKTIEITWDIRDASMIKVIRVLLQNARVLEKLKLRFRNQEACPGRFASTKNRVMKMPRSSPHATLIVTEELIKKLS